MNTKRGAERPTPTFDEGWWEAVLADEKSHGLTKTVRAPGQAGRPNTNRTGPRDTSLTDWNTARELFSEDGIVELRVIACNRGGLLVEGEKLGGFVPYSHLVDVSGPVGSADKGKVLESYVGRRLRLKIIECVPEDGRIVLSERAAQAEPGKRAEIFQRLRVGERAGGTVTNITDFGVFVDLGGVEGLIHISELSWGRVIHPSQTVKLGENVQVEVLELSPERCRVALSLKRLQANPWTDLETQLRPGTETSALITSILSYGAFARLERGVEGLIHVSEMPIAEGQTVKDVVREGQAVTVRVLHIDPAHQRMGLSMKLAE